MHVAIPWLCMSQIQCGKVFSLIELQSVKRIAWSLMASIPSKLCALTIRDVNQNIIFGVSSTMEKMSDSSKSIHEALLIKMLRFEQLRFNISIASRRRIKSE